GNRTENRLLHKPSKRDLEISDQRLLHDDLKYRCVSREGEIPFENYLRLENADLSASEAAQIIRDTFRL
ncbi:MAG: shikimate kinase, partial [Oscillospiraceae bacterium]|nr:shikimate kinase [Oscillospiraceae bacterium]